MTATSSPTVSRRIDDRVGADARHREFGRPAGNGKILQRHASCAGDERLALAVLAAQPDAQPFDVAPAVVEEMQPDLPAVAGEPADDDLAAIHPHRPLVVGQFAPNLLRKRAWVGGLRQRVGGGSDRDVDAELRHGSRDDLVEEVAARQQVQHLAGDGRAIVHDREVGERRKIARRYSLEKREHGSNRSEIRGIDLQDRVGAIREGFGGSERRFSLRQVVGERGLGLSCESPAARDHPRAASGGGQARPRGDARNR